MIVQDAVGLIRLAHLRMRTQDPDVFGTIEEVASFERLQGATESSIR